MQQDFKGTAQNQESTRKADYSQIFFAAIIIIISGIMLMLFGVVSKSYPLSISEWFIEAGRTVLVTGIMVFFYEYALRHFFLRKIDEVFKNTIESVTIRLKAISEEVNLFGEKIEDIEETVVFAKKAIESGLVTVHATRESALNRLKEKINQTNDETTIKLCGISLGDFLLERGKLHKLFVECLDKKNNFKFEVIILDADSEAAKERARREEPDTYCDEGYEATGAYNELIAARKKAESLQKRYNKDKLELKTSNVYALCFLATIKDTMFMEPYNYARRGSEAPVLEIKRSDEEHAEHDLFKIYVGHFESLWKKPNQGDENTNELCTKSTKT
ncbi:MAG: hypothetical protein WAW23_13465 [Candidatus Methanoperedens sp.]